MATQTPDLPAAPSAGTDPLAQTLALLQPWIDYVPKQQQRLGIFIFLALLAHLATFFFIRIDTTRSELRHQPHTHVTVENFQTVSQEAQSVNNFWDRMTDPRLFVLPATPMAGLSSGELAPDFTAINPSMGSPQLPSPARPADYEVESQPVLPLEQRVAATMVPMRQPFFYNETPRAIATSTTWQWDNSLAHRNPLGVTTLPSPVSDTELTPTELRIAVAPDGTVQHVLVEKGSGKLDLDEQAVLAARKIRFQASEQPGLLWGRTTIFWYYTAPPREEVLPTPPSSP